MTYHSLLKSLSSIVNNNIYLLHMDQEVKRTFTPQPMVSYRSARKLSSYLVRAKLYPIERKVGLCKCKGKRCEICKNVLETDTFTCNNDPTTYKINHQFDCNEKCLVFLITCNKYLKQYVGQTVDMFRSRWNNNKDISKNLIEEKTVCKKTFTNIFSYQLILAFCKIPILLSLIGPILGHPRSMKITGFIPLRTKSIYGTYWASILHSYGTTTSFPEFRRLVLGLFLVYSNYYFCWLLLLLLPIVWIIS